jgi:hypothetical protein
LALQPVDPVQAFANPAFALGNAKVHNRLEVFRHGVPQSPADDDDTIVARILHNAIGMPRKGHELIEKLRVGRNNCKGGRRE